MSSTTTSVDPTAAEAVRAFWPDGRAKNFVGGSWVDAGGVSDVVDPSTGRPYATAPDSSRADIAAAVDAAAAAQPAWARLTLLERAEALTAFRAALLQGERELALLESVDSGNSLTSTHRDVGLAIKYLSTWPGYAHAHAGRMTAPVPDGFSYTLHRPYGVVGKIVAFNHPSLFAITGMILPLMAGNTVVVKASPQAPLGTLALGKFFAEALPAGVVNLVSGGPDAGDALVTDPRIKRLAFVGSLPTALAIQSRAAASGAVKHLSFELGGKNAMIVFPDVDLDAAVEAAFAGMSFTVSAGQSCQSTSRLLLHESISTDFLERLVPRLQDVHVGPAYDTNTQMGPLVSRSQLERVTGYIEAGRRAGARLLTGGRAPDRSDTYAGGYYLEPTLFSEVTPEMVIGREEIFGPVLSALTWSGYEQMLALANDIDLGLSAAIWTRDINLALRTAARIDAGYIWVNDANRHYLGAPFGGVKNSGTGREECAEEYATYLETTAVNIKVPEQPTTLPARRD